MNTKAIPGTLPGFAVVISLPFCLDYKKTYFKNSIVMANENRHKKNVSERSPLLNVQQIV